MWAAQGFDATKKKPKGDEASALTSGRRSAIEQRCWYLMCPHPSDRITDVMPGYSSIKAVYRGTGWDIHPITGRLTEPKHKKQAAEPVVHLAPEKRRAPVGDSSDDFEHSQIPLLRTMDSTKMR